MLETWQIVIAGLLAWLAYHKGWLGKLRNLIAPQPQGPPQSVPIAPSPNGSARVDPDDPQSLLEALERSLDARHARQLAAEAELAQQAKLDEMMRARIAEKMGKKA